MNSFRTTFHICLPFSFRFTSFISHKYHLASVVFLLLFTFPFGASGEATMLDASTQSPYQVTPSRYQCGQSHCYWETPMDIRNTDAVWQMLMQPMAIIKGHPRDTIPLYVFPDHAAEVIGEVTCASQGIHLLETLPDGWSRIECYSKKKENGKSVLWNQLTDGYVPSDLIEQVEVRTKFGLVVDKLAQRMYVFQEGELLATLRISTGLPTIQSPAKETTAGEFVLCSPVGTYVTDGGAYCAMAIRFNRGSLLHEIPYVLDENGEKSYRAAQSQLGKRASDGCIRVQRMRTSNGINMRWLWNNLRKEMGTRLVLWEDVPGRALPFPPEDMLIYYNNQDDRYHAADTCYGRQNERLPFLPIAYGDLSKADYQHLLPCEYCVPPMPVSEIIERNQICTPVITAEE